MSEFTEREYDWEDEIERESEFVLVPEGDYDFEVVKFERGRHNGSAKLPPCNKAILTIKIDNGRDYTLVTHNLFLHSKCEGMLCAFFTAIGARKHGERIKMNWSIVTGATGRCKVEINRYTNDRGEERENNRITKFYDKDPEPTVDPSAIPQNTEQSFF